ncbi:MAG: hypothetical protein AB8F95_19310 [Bacteroidia bacterium]
MPTTQSLKKQFFQSIQCGTGKAYIIAQENPDVDFASYIIKGALNNYAYDGQSEGSRATYIFELISLSGQQAKIREAILEGLATEQDDTWSLVQLFNLAKMYAERGDAEAKKAIYQRFMCNTIEGSSWAGYDEILALDGLKGLFFIAEKFGKKLEEDPDYWQDRFIVDSFQKENPNIPVTAELEAAAKTNRHIRIYLDEINKREDKQEAHRSARPVYDNILDEIFARPFILRKLDGTELLIVANQLLIEKDKGKFEKMLAVFARNQFPFDPDFIFRLTKRRPTSKNRIQEYALDALKLLQSDEIRAFALERIPKARLYPATFTSLLIANYQEGDAELLCQVIDKFKDEHIIEELAISYAQIFDKNPTPACKEPLERLYRKMNCGIHRYGILKTLMQNDVLSDMIKREIKHDSYEGTRALLKQNEIQE